MKRKTSTVDDLLVKFGEAAGGELSNDRYDACKIN